MSCTEQRLIWKRIHQSARQVRRLRHKARPNPKQGSPRSLPSPRSTFPASCPLGKLSWTFSQRTLVGDEETANRPSVPAEIFDSALLQINWTVGFFFTAEAATKPFVPSNIPESMRPACFFSSILQYSTYSSFTSDESSNEHPQEPQRVAGKSDAVDHARRMLSAILQGKSFVFCVWRCMCYFLPLSVLPTLNFRMLRHTCTWHTRVFHGS